MISLETINDDVYTYLDTLAGGVYNNFKRKLKSEYLPPDIWQFCPMWMLRPPSLELLEEMPTRQDIYLVMFELIVIGPQSIKPGTTDKGCLELIDALHLKIHGNAFTNTFNHYHALVRSITHLGRELHFEPNAFVGAYVLEFEGQRKDTHNFVP